MSLEFRAAFGLICFISGFGCRLVSSCLYNIAKKDTDRGMKEDRRQRKGNQGHWRRGRHWNSKVNELEVFIYLLLLYYIQFLFE